MKTFAEFKELLKDEAFLKELKVFAAEKKPRTPDEEAGILIDFAKSKGFEITAEELSLEKALKKDDLTPEELNAVAGGSLTCGWFSGECIAWASGECVSFANISDL